MASKQPAQELDRRRPGGGVRENFWDRLDRRGECWLWTGAKDQNGYGVVKIDGRSWKVHRYAWRLAHGQEPGPGVAIAQTCGRRNCCLPDHLIQRAAGRRHRQARRPSGAGSVAEVRPGVWEPRVSVGRNPKTGVYDRVTRTFAGSSTGAQRAIAELVAEVAAGTQVGARTRWTHCSMPGSPICI